MKGRTVGGPVVCPICIKQNKRKTKLYTNLKGHQVRAHGIPLNSREVKNEQNKKYLKEKKQRELRKEEDQEIVEIIARK